MFQHCRFTKDVLTELKISEEMFFFLPPVLAPMTTKEISKSFSDNDSSLKQIIKGIL